MSRAFAPACRDTRFPALFTRFPPALRSTSPSPDHVALTLSPPAPLTARDRYKALAESPEAGASSVKAGVDPEEEEVAVMERMGAWAVRRMSPLATRVDPEMDPDVDPDPSPPRMPIPTPPYYREVRPVGERARWEEVPPSTLVGPVGEVRVRGDPTPVVMVVEVAL